MTLSSTPQPSGARPPGRPSYRGPTHVDSTSTAGVVQVMGRTTTGTSELSLSLRRPKEAYQFRVRFSGDGHEYFRIWLVSLLLTVLTLSLYRPWARLRSLRYFYEHTHVRKHPLGFHGDPWKMLRGHLLVGLLLLGYVFSYETSPQAAVLGFVSLAVLWPALFRASMQFRMSQTSWRGMRFGFVGSLRGTYLFFAMPVLSASLLTAVCAAMPDSWQMAARSVSALLLYALMPWFYWLLKKYEHDHYTYAQFKAELRAGPGPFYRVFMRTTVAGALVLVPAVLVLALLAAFTWGTLQPLMGGKAWADALQQTGVAWVPLGGLAVLALVLFQAVVRAHFTAGMQNLMWSRTGSRVFRFKSELPVGPLVRMLFKQGVLTVLTLGLYHPFAQVERARMRLEAMTLVSRASLDELVSYGQGAGGYPGHTAGHTAAGDLMAMDFGS